MHDDQTHDNDTRTRSSTPPVPTPTSPSSTSTSQGPRSPPPPASSTGYSTTSPELQRIHKGALKMGDLKDWITNVFYNGDTRHAAILIKRMKDHIKEICQQERRNLDPGYNMTWGDLEERRRKSMILDLENRCAADGLHLEWAKDHWAAKWLLYQKFNADHYNKTKNKETEAQPSTAAATADSGADDDHDMMDAEPDG
ncbi:hypothetical protein VTP01DRAFT_7817, partial [Rhizomucor pusillus]|uniref:uncharacterized protein n=1 Tax=Rhizomucor pusillus TaxID=4840 RepID=UPI00374388EE